MVSNLRSPGSLSYSPYADLIWCETAQPDLEEARVFAEAIHAVYPGKMLAYNCSPSFNWSRHLDEATIARFQKELGTMGYRYQFITLAGFHAQPMPRCLSWPGAMPRRECRPTWSFRTGSSPWRVTGIPPPDINAR